MEQTMVLPEDRHILEAYCYLWSIEIGEPVAESCGFLVFETMPEIRDELLSELGGTVI